MSRELLQQALDLLKSAHVSTALIWERHDCVNALEQELAKPEQEPQMIQIKDGQLSYIKKPWVGLTQEELDEIQYSTQVEYTTYDEGKYGMEIEIRPENFARAIEAKLKEKNT